jgi:hypothetical protein
VSRVYLDWAHLNRVLPNFTWSRLALIAVRTK